MAVESQPAEDTDFSVRLERWLSSDQPKTLGALHDVFGEKTFAVTAMLLMLVPALPLPTGGITHVFELITLIVAFEMVLGLGAIWLPERFRCRELGALTTGKALPFVVRRVRWFERFSRPRMAGLFENRMFLRLLGLLIMVFTLGAALAPPFSGLDTLPALGVVVIALAIVLDDVVVLGVGIVIGLGGIALIVTIGAALARFLRDRL